MKIAIVHDDLIQLGGAERMVLALLEAFPNADLYASIVGRRWRRVLHEKGIKVKTSWMQKLPWVEALHRHYFPLYPLAFESFNFDGYDLVISSSARFAHSILTKPGTTHIAYINSPGRMFWEPQGYFEKSNFLEKILTTPLLSYLRIYDYFSARRPDYIIANSFSVAKKVEKYWNLKSNAVIYPFVESVHSLHEAPEGYAKAFPSGVSPSEYFLVISRLNHWKRIDLAIEACNELGLPLIIVGDGPARKGLEKAAGQKTLFLGRLSEEEKWRYIRGCRALIQTQREDFGITALEANYCGKPVIAFGQGGALETTVDGQTGTFFTDQTVPSLVEALYRFKSYTFAQRRCIEHTMKFSKETFINNFLDFISVNVKTPVL